MNIEKNTNEQPKSIRQLALEWWENLESERQIEIEKDFGYYGHDIGTTEIDIIYFYKLMK